MANAERINKVIASIKGEIEHTKNLGFNMEDWVTDSSEDMTGRQCGTVACIAGHAYILQRKRNIEESANLVFGSSVVENATSYLRLDPALAERLFYAWDHDADIADITPEQAIRTLEHLRDTGEISWTV